jgi:hypothetical protein
MNHRAMSAPTLSVAMAATRGVAYLAANAGSPRASGATGVANGDGGTGPGEDVSPGLTSGGLQRGIPRDTQKSTRFLRLVARRGWPGLRDATAIAWAAR